MHRVRAQTRDSLALACQHQEPDLTNLGIAPGADIQAYPGSGLSAGLPGKSAFDPLRAFDGLRNLKP